jgi:hypothetical protein
MMMISGENDILSPIEDRLKMKNTLPEVQEWLTMKDHTHLDVIWSKNAHKDIHPHILAFL